MTDVLITASDLAELIKKEPCVIVDTRNPDAYAAGHLPGAVNVHEIFTYLATSTPEGMQELKTKFADAFGAAAATLDLWQWAFGWSVLVDAVLRHKGWQYEWSIDHARVLPRGEGLAIACALLKRLARPGLPTLVVAEYNRYVFQNEEHAAETRRATAAVLKCAGDLGLPTLDMFGILDEAVRRRGLDAIFLSSHPGPDGARLAADAIATAMEKRKIP